MTCSQCSFSNVTGSRFCQNCGAALGVTLLQGKTVVAASPGRMRVEPLDRPPVTLSRRSALASAPTQVCSATPASGQQRELTFYIVDVSGSMNESYDGVTTKLEAAIRAGVTMALNKYRIDPLDEAGLISFSDAAKVVFAMAALVTERARFIAALQSLTIDGGTDINTGLVVARDSFDWKRPNVVRRILLLTDGHGGNPLRAATDLKSKGVVIDVIGVGDCEANVDSALLKKLASTVQGALRYRFIKNDQRTLLAHVTHVSQKTSLGS